MVEFLIILFYASILLESLFKGFQDVDMKSGHKKEWVNKYKQPLEPLEDWFPKNKIDKLYKFYHKNAGLSYKERYFLAGTMLVSLQDKWHRFGFFRTLCLWVGSFSFLGVIYLSLNTSPLIFLIGLLYMILKPIMFHLSYK